MKISSWNVNSINARLENLLFWLKETNPDIVLLQELKCEEGKFPFEQIADLGYNIEVFGQKSYNGVAILSKFPLEDVKKNFDKSDNESRYIEALACLPDKAIRVASIYVPNGGAKLKIGQKPDETERFSYKMRFFDDLYQRMAEIFNYNEIAIFGGDYNIAAENIDVYDPKSLKNTICFHQKEQEKLRKILNLGYLDSFRIKNPNTQNFSWWDYRGNSWNYNKGMRIDYLLVSPQAADYLENAFMDDKMMMGRSKPSDHCPISLTFMNKS